jgi:hypothetical protein
LSCGLRGVLLLALAPFDHGRDEELLGELAAGHPQRRKRCQPAFDDGIRNALRMKLFVDVSGDAHLPDPLCVASTRAIAEAVQHMSDGPVVVREWWVGIGAHENWMTGPDHHRESQSDRRQGTA